MKTTWMFTLFLATISFAITPWLPARTTCCFIDYTSKTSSTIIQSDQSSDFNFLKKYLEQSVNVMHHQGEKISKEDPLGDIQNWWTASTILLQFKHRDSSDNKPADGYVLETITQYDLDSKRDSSSSKLLDRLYIDRVVDLTLLDPDSISAVEEGGDWCVEIRTRSEAGTRAEAIEYNTYSPVLQDPEDAIDKALKQLAGPDTPARVIDEFEIDNLMYKFNCVDPIFNGSTYDYYAIDTIANSTLRDHFEATGRNLASSKDEIKEHSVLRIPCETEDNALKIGSALKRLCELAWRKFPHWPMPLNLN